jgi:hypothetical protein
MTTPNSALTFVPVRPDALLRPAKTAAIRFSYAVASLLGLTGLVLGVPSIWSLLSPDAETFGLEAWRDIDGPAFAGAVLCFILGHRIIARARLSWNTTTQQAIAAMRQTAWKQNIWLDVEIADSFPRILLSRRDRIIALAGHDGIMIPADAVAATETARLPWPGLMRSGQPVLRLKLKPQFGGSDIYVTAGDGITPASPSRVHALKEQLAAFNAEMRKPIVLEEPEVIHERVDNVIPLRTAGE